MKDLAAVYKADRALTVLIQFVFKTNTSLKWLVKEEYKLVDGPLIVPNAALIQRAGSHEGYLTAICDGVADPVTDIQC